MRMLFWELPNLDDSVTRKYTAVSQNGEDATPLHNDLT